MECHACGGVAIGIFAVNIARISLLNNGPANASSVDHSIDFHLEHIFPEPINIIVPDAVPILAASFYKEATEDMQRGRSPAGIIAKCRSVLDLCLKELKAAGKGRKAQIADLRGRGLLTESIAVWAEKLWDDGNDAIHDLTGSAEKARQHVSFLKLFFDVAFALPQQVSNAQEETAATQTPDA